MVIVDMHLEVGDCLLGPSHEPSRRLNISRTRRGKCCITCMSTYSGRYVQGMGEQFTYLRSRAARRAMWSQPANQQSAFSTCTHPCMNCLLTNLTSVSVHEVSSHLGEITLSLSPFLRYQYTNGGINNSPVQALQSHLIRTSLSSKRPRISPQTKHSHVNPVLRANYTFRTRRACNGLFSHVEHFKVDSR